MQLARFLNSVFKKDGFILIDANSKNYIIGSPQNNNPIPAFTAAPQVTYENQPVSFVNNTVNASTWTWSFEGGSPNTYNGENPPEISYSNTGSFDVSLTVGVYRQVCVTSNVDEVCSSSNLIIGPIRRSYLGIRSPTFDITVRKVRIKGSYSTSVNRSCS